MDARLRLLMMPAVTVPFALLALAVVAAPAAAHEHVLAPPLEFVIGWGTEPAVAGSQNTIDIAVEFHPDANTTEMLVGVADNLTVTIRTGPASAPKTVEPSFGRPGWYNFPIIPTREGVYNVTVTGTINGTIFNISAEPEQVFPAGDFAFPVLDPTVTDLQGNDSAQQAQIDALRAQVAALNSTGESAQIDQLKKDNTDLRSGVSTAMTVGALGLAVGLVGMVVGAVGMRKGRGNP